MKSAGSRIEIAHAGRIPAFDPVSLRRDTRRMLELLRIGPVYLSLFLVDDRTIRRINAEHLNHDDATDVITFELETLQAAPAGRLPWWGEIVISLTTARRQARFEGHRFYYETCFYVIHGILHLCGWRDSRAADRRRMLEEQTRILEQLGIGKG